MVTESLLTREVISHYPVEVQNNVNSDKSNKYGSAGFVKKPEGPGREIVDK
jgi:hypothetical protein